MALIGDPNNESLGVAGEFKSVVKYAWRCTTTYTAVPGKIVKGSIR